jgi:acetyl-CoA C-acetyltransferase
MESVVVVSTARTPIGSLLGNFSAMQAYELGAISIKNCLDSKSIDPAHIDEVVMGNVLTAGQGQAPARQAALGAGLANNVTATTINKMCGSGMQSVIMACNMLQSGSRKVVIAGGMESMTNAPYLLPKTRAGMKAGHGKIIDHMFYDGLEDAYERGNLMGVYAEATASKYEFSRAEQDEFAIASLEKAKNAQSSGAFAGEIFPLEVKTRKEVISIDYDEQPGKAKIDKIPKLKPAFNKEGTVTAANASSISDGAASLVLMLESTAASLGYKPIAKIVAHDSFAHEPRWFTTAPVGAMQSVLNLANWQLSDVDLFEINEAFAVVTLAAIKELSIDPKKVNVYGGACALGHPIGASGARIICTLVNALLNEGKNKGLASLCIGGGEGIALALEIV